MEALKRASRKIDHEPHSEAIQDDLIENLMKSLTTKRARLWVAARDKLARKLKRAPSNEEMVDFALTPAGKSIRRLFPFADVEGSARKWWVYLAGCYTRQAHVVLAGDGTIPDIKVRAPHVVREDGKQVIERLDHVIQTRSHYEEMLGQARSYLETFAIKYEQLAHLRKDKRLVSAIRHVRLAIEALR